MQIRITVNSYVPLRYLLKNNIKVNDCDIYFQRLRSYSN